MLLVFLATALAGDAQGGLQVQVFPTLIDKLASWLDGETYAVAKKDVSAEYDCWDLLGVRNFNLDIPVEEVTLTPRNGELDIRLEFGEIRGEDMELYAVDEEWTDSCVEFEAWVSYVSLTDASLEAALTLDVDPDAFHFGFDGTPVITGDLDTDIEWFPDDIVLYFFEDEILAALEESIAEVVPGYLDEMVAETVLEGEYEDWSFGLEPVGATITSDGVWMEADASVGWSGDDGCPMRGVDASDGRNPTLDFGDGDGSSFGVGLTERMVADLFLALYEDGYFCFTEENVQEFLLLVQDLFDPSVAGLGATAELGEAPEVRIDRDGIHFALSAVEIRVTGELDGQTRTLLDVTANLSGLLELSLDRPVSSFKLSVVDLDLDITRFDAEHLVVGDGSAERHLQDFLEGWVVDWAVKETQDVELYGSLWHLYGQVILVDRLEYEDGGLRLYCTLYDEDDPAVDSEAPETTAEAYKQGRDTVRISWGATDDRDGALAWSWRMDGRAWSSYTTEGFVDIAGVKDGTHTVEVVARDGWWNVDPTPALITFDVEALAAAPSGGGGGCGCEAGTGASGYVATALAVAWAGRRRRKNARHSSGL